MIEICFPDQSVRSYKKGITPFEIAKGISESLARNVLSASFNGNTVEATTPLEDNGSIQLFTWKDQEGKNAFWHSSAHILAQTILELYPIFSRMRMLRQWGGIVDICPDASPIISKTSIKGLYFNCGWGTGGFKATPGSGDLFAHTIANDEPHKLNAAFNINRFVSGDLVDEHGAAAVAH